MSVTYTVNDVVCSNCHAGYSTLEIPKGCRLSDKHCANCECKTLVKVARPTLKPSQESKGTGDRP